MIAIRIDRWRRSVATRLTKGSSVTEANESPSLQFDGSMTRVESTEQSARGIAAGSVAARTGAAGRQLNPLITAAQAAAERNIESSLKQMNVSRKLIADPSRISLRFASHCGRAVCATRIEVSTVAHGPASLKATRRIARQQPDGMSHSGYEETM